MSYEFEYLLHLVSVSTFGYKVEEPAHPIDWKKLFQIAKEQTVFTNAVYALKQLSQPIIDADVYKDALKEYRWILASEFVRRDATYRLLDELKKSDIPFVILKGISLSALYAVPETRVSADLDIYVGKENEDKAANLLKQLGVQIQERDPKCQEAKCIHPQIGVIELHAYLFCEEDRKYWFARGTKFAGITGEYTIISDNSGYDIPVLSNQDNASFLMLHVIKHFIKEGISLRHIADIALFIQKTSTSFNMEKVWEELRKLKFDKIIHAILSCCVYYMSINQSDFPGLELIDKKLVDEFLSDIESGGNLGIKEKSYRSESKKVFDKYVFDELGYNSVQYVWKRKSRFLGLFGAMFCCKEKLLKYPCVRRNKVYIPFAWLHYVGTGILKIVRGKIRPVRMSVNTPISDIAQRRVNLFKKLDMM